MIVGLSVNTLNNKSRDLDGIGVYTSLLFLGLLKAGEKIVPITHKNKLPDNRIVMDDDLSYDCQPLAFNWPFELSGPLAAFMKIDTLGSTRIGNKIDVYHCTDYHQPRMRKTPIVTTLHDAIFLQQPDWCRKRLRWFKNEVIKQLAKQAHKMICVSEAAKQDVCHYFNISENKITVIHHGLDPFWLKKISFDTQRAELLKMNINGNYLLFTGTLQPRKNVYRLLKAYQMLPLALRQQFQLVVVGKKGWDEKALLELQHLSSNHSEMVKWLGYVSKEQLRILYQGSSLFVFPSLYEGFGLPILEAFASGVPVITSNCSAMPEVAGDAAFLVDPLEIDSLASAIEKVLTDSILSASLSEKGEKRLENFMMQNCIQKTIQVYREVAE